MKRKMWLFAGCCMGALLLGSASAEDEMIEYICEYPLDESVLGAGL